jgi:hypothetical protein
MYKNRAILKNVKKKLNLAVILNEMTKIRVSLSVKMAELKTKDKLKQIV